MSKQSSNQIHMEYFIRKMLPSDWEQVSSIYQEGIQTGIATFQHNVPSWQQWDKDHCDVCRIVAISNESILGWAALTPVSNRCVYAGVAEVSVYVGRTYQGLGVGKKLLFELIELSEEHGFWTLQSGIIRENIASQHLHLKCGFREVGIRKRFGQMPSGRWHDIVLMERRSDKI